LPETPHWPGKGTWHFLKRCTFCKFSCLIIAAATESAKILPRELQRSDLHLNPTLFRSPFTFGEVSQSNKIFLQQSPMTAWRK
jgi:hypothetical protein